MVGKQRNQPGAHRRRSVGKKPRAIADETLTGSGNVRRGGGYGNRIFFADPVRGPTGKLAKLILPEMLH